ncbi:MAG: bifunctional adenosylcobinamide kinase/adenosylcobinamide-phosphate guanylyltransferase [Rikenellaceae bacterium]
MAKVIYISGGQRSGKSHYAESMVESLSATPTYLATAKCWDSEFEKRIARHKAARGSHWENIERERELSSLNLNNKVVLLDCVTLWLTNIFSHHEFNLEKSLEEAKSDFDNLLKQDCTIVVVSNEIGTGVIPMERSTRAFVDLQGWVNQHIASAANEAYTLISGIPLKLK